MNREVTREIEAAATILHNRSPKCYESFGDEDDGCRCVVKATEALAAAFVVKVACEQCGGTNWVHVRSLDLETGVEQAESPDFNCPAEHVKLDNPYGGVVYVDPTKVEWRCQFINHASLKVPNLDDATPHEFQGLSCNERCRWVPKPLEVTE